MLADPAVVRTGTPGLRGYASRMGSRRGTAVPTRRARSSRPWRVIVLALVAFASQPAVGQATSDDPTASPAPSPSVPASQPPLAITPEILTMWSPVDPTAIPFDYSCGGA